MGYEDEMEDYHDEEKFNRKQLEQLKKEILDEANIELGKNYPKPIVDLKTSRQEALAAFAQLKVS